MARWRNSQRSAEQQTSGGQHGKRISGGRTVLITGAAKGIGRATALGFAKEGARIAAVDIDKGDLASLVAKISAMGGEAASGIGDLSTAMVSSIAEALKAMARTLMCLSTMWVQGRSALSISCPMRTGTRHCSSTS